MTKVNLMKILITVLLVVCCGCGGNSYDGSEGAQATDYSQSEHWLSLPHTDRSVDVFYLYPTVWQKEDDSDPNINTIDNTSMLAGAEIALQRQASLFADVGNVYAPYYRQADGPYTLSLVPEERESLIGGIPTQDAVAAFDYFIQDYNAGRPFILAGHSQGANVLLHLLSGYLQEHPEIYSRMVAAYVIGYSVTESYLEINPHLSFAGSADDTGVIISYNTQAPQVIAGENPLVLAGAVAINPISWTRGEQLADVANGLGSFLPVDGNFTLVPQYADAQVDLTQGVVVTTADSEGLVQDFGSGVYHRYDYLFYYFNLRENAQIRINAYFENHDNSFTPFLTQQ